MSPLLPPPLLILAGAIGFALALPRVRRPTSNGRMMAEVFTLVVGTCWAFPAVWALYWWIEQWR
jgi:hypothetical protein